MGMSAWRYAVTRSRNEEGFYYEIREVYTDEDGKLSWTEDAVAPYGETLKEIQEALTRMASDALGNVLDLTTDPPEWVDPITIRRRDREQS